MSLKNKLSNNSKVKLSQRERYEQEFAELKEKFNYAKMERNIKKICLVIDKSTMQKSKSNRRVKGETLIKFIIDIF